MVTVKKGHFSGDISTSISAGIGDNVNGGVGTEKEHKRGIIDSF